MKLAFCTFKYFPYSGLSRDLLRVLQECHRRGHEVHVYAFAWEGEYPEGIHINLLRVLPLGNHTRNASFYRQFRRKTTNQQFDAVIGFNKMPGLDFYYAADSCYLAKTARHYGPLYRLTPRYRNFYSFERAVFDVRSSTTILSISEREKGIYQQHYGTPEHRFKPLPPTLDSDRKLREPHETVRQNKRKELGMEDHQFLLLFIGSGFKTKGLDRAIRAVASLPGEIRGRSRLVVVGQDSKQEFQQLATGLGLPEHIQFLGGRDDVLEIMTAGDILVHPAYKENTGTVLIEAIVTGLPVLTTDICGYAPHITQAEAGIVLHSPFDQNELNEQLHTMLLSDERLRWHENGIAYGKDPRLYRMPQTVCDLIEEGVGQQCRAAGEDPAREIDDTCIYLRKDLQDVFDPASAFDQIMALDGEEVRNVPGRRTIKLNLGDHTFYLKTHTGVGWQEIVKNILYFRMPVLGAMNEWHGIHHLNRLGIDTLTAAGCGITGDNPAKRRSFILTDEIADTISLAELFTHWLEFPPRGPDEIRYKRWLIHQVARIARNLHNSGANHRDFYLCHFLLKRGYTAGKPDLEKSRLYVIDLHRMQLRKRTPVRWAIKDIAGLYFSSKDMNLTSRDRYRFMKVYRSGSLREVFGRDQRFWKRVYRRGENLYQSKRQRA